jgi:hypothetical protein|tara:strand:- start:534 stop:773 length:240 start_codon:yes stop_codon:yes gene_type:complete
MSEQDDEIYVYVHFLDIGASDSPRANMLMIEKQDIVDMFEASTHSETVAYELSGMKPEDFFPMDGVVDEQESTYILFKV